MKHDSNIEFLYGDKIAEDKLVQSGMKELEKSLFSEFKANADDEANARKHVDSLYHSLFENKADANATSAVKALRQMHENNVKNKVADPESDTDKERIFTGSIAATKIPPFNYQWTWQAETGGAGVSASADRASGKMRFNTHSNSNHYSKASVRTALGIFFRPVTENGILRLTSRPSFNYNWWDYCTLASAHSDGFIGMYVGRYNQSGGFDRTIVDQKRSLWSDSSWWSGGSGRGSNSGFPLSAQFNVDRSHWYALWIWCGGNISAEGFHTFHGSGSGAVMSVAVPSITWQLF